MGRHVLIGLTSEMQPEARLRALDMLAAHGEPVAWLEFAPAPSADLLERVGSRVDRIAPKPYAEEAHRRVRERYPAFLHDFAREHGLLNLWSWRAQLGVWWLMPISEMSSFRTPLIHIVYQLEVIDQVLADLEPQGITLLTDDPLIVEVVRGVAERHGASLEQVIHLRRRLSLRRRLGQWGGLRRCWFAFRRILLWITLRFTGVGRLAGIAGNPAEGAWALFCTLFPSMWEPGSVRGSLSNRSFGDWPSRLAMEGYQPVYGAMTMAPAGRIVWQALRLRPLLAANRVVLLDTLLSFRTLLACCLGIGWIRAYRRWKRGNPSPTASYNGNDLGPLLLREIEHDLQSPEISFNLCVAEGIFHLVKRLGAPGCITYPFEYQPLEKAFTAGIRLAGSRAPIVGFQTGLTGKNHLGYWFPADQVSQNGGPGDPSLAPLPDVIAVNGRSTLEILRRRLEPDRLVLSGPVRLAHLRGLGNEKPRHVAALRKRYAIPDTCLPVVIATSIIRDETLVILDLAFRAGKRFEEIFFLVKDHPLDPLRRAVRDLARRHGLARYRYFTRHTADLLLLSRVAITGCTSVGVEAIALGCMPIVYADSCRYDLNALRDVEEAAFFFQDEESFQRALAQCLTGGEEFQRRQARWPGALEALLDFSDGDPGSTLLKFLNGQGALTR